MENAFSKVKKYLVDLGYDVEYENEQEGVFVIHNEETGVNKMVLGCADPLLIMEQFICEVKHESMDIYKMLLQKNRDIIHGAFVLDHTGRRVIFRDTLQLSTLDLNELEAAFNSLGLLLSEFSGQIIKISK